MNHCQHCNKEITRKDKRGKYCSRSCAVSVNNLTPKRKKVGPSTQKSSETVIEKGKKRRYKLSHNCVMCGREYQTFTKNSFLCSKSCLRQKNLKIALLKFESGDLSSVVLLRKCLSQTHSSCAKCNVGSEYNGLPLTLQIDHIDGNSDNNRPSNLRFLCPNCHSQTPNFGSKNRGSGRTTRKKYRNDLNKMRKRIRTADLEGCSFAT